MDTEPQNELISTPNKILSTKKRVLLFFITYMVGVLLVTGIILGRVTLDSWGFVDQSVLAKVLLRRAFRVFFTTPFVLPVGFVLAVEWVLQDVFGLNVILVSGLHIPSPENPMDTPLQAVSQGLTYLLFLSITIIGVFTNNQRTFRILYYVFIGLLIMAIGGCMRLH